MIREIPWKRIESVCNKLEAYEMTYNVNGGILEIKTDKNRIARDILEHIEEYHEFHWYYIYPEEHRIIFSDRAKTEQTTFGIYAETVVIREYEKTKDTTN